MTDSRKVIAWVTRIGAVDSNVIHEIYFSSAARAKYMVRAVSMTLPRELTRPAAEKNR